MKNNTFFKLITMNGKVFVHIIATDEKTQNLYDTYLNQQQITNLFNNKNTTITIKKHIPENNDKKFKPRGETLGKLDTKNNILKIAIGKTGKAIESTEDIEKTYIFKYSKELDNIFNILTTDFLKYEEYKQLKSELAKQYNNKNNIKNIDI